MNLKNKITVENNYSGSNWNFEKTTKYLIEINGMDIEAGYFEHYKDKTLVKTVLELPQSYGCPTKCRFCASAAIEQFTPLDAECLEELFLYLYDLNNLSEKNYVLLTMTGIGDIYFNYENVESFLLKIKTFGNVYVTISSCLWNVEMLQKVDKLSQQIRIRNVQITYVTDEKEKLGKIVPFYQKHEYSFEKLLQYMMDSEAAYYRINYIMIKGVNDGMQDFYRFRDHIKGIAGKVVVRISKLNETGATRRNHLQSTDIATLRDFQSVLQETEIESYIFYAYKNDNMNCGQLITER